MPDSHDNQGKINQIIEDFYDLVNNNMVTAYNPRNGEIFDISGIVLNNSRIQINLISNKCEPQ